MPIGIDTVRMRWKASAKDLCTALIDRPEWTHEYRPQAEISGPAGQSLRQAQILFQDPATGLRIQARADGSGWWEASLPRIVHGDNKTLCTPSDAEEAMAYIHGLIGADPRLGELREPALARIDVAGDWHGPVAPWRAAALTARWSRSRAIPNPELWSTTIGRHGHNQMVIYDKGMESGGQAEQHGRCEIREWKPKQLWHKLDWTTQWWRNQAAMLGGNSPLNADANHVMSALVATLVDNPHSVAKAEAILRAGSRSTLARFRRSLRASRARAGLLGADLVALVDESSLAA